MGRDGSQYDIADRAMTTDDSSPRNRPVPHGRWPEGADDFLRVRAKAELRKSIARVRAFYPRDVRAAASAEICARLVALDVFQSARSIALFRSLLQKGEVDTAPIDAAARAAGKRVAYPALDDAEVIAEAIMTFHWVDHAQATAFEDRGRGFEEPVAAPVATEIDLIIVPALAFDPTGHRLGYGAGFYDKTIPRHPEATTVGVGYDFQLLVDIPKTATDVAVSTIVTDKRVIECARGAP